MTRYYVRYNHTREWYDWNSEPEQLRRETSKNLLMILDAETEPEARKAVRESVEFTDKIEIVSVSTTVPTGFEFLANKELGFYAPLTRTEKRNINWMV